MSLRHLQGWALITSGLIWALLRVFRVGTLTGGMPYVVDILTIVYFVCFIAGLPGIQSVQPQTKHLGMIGLILMCLPPLHDLFTSLIILFAEYPLVLNQRVSATWDILASVGFVYLGYIIVGWLTVQARVFPAWAGWLLFIVGIINDVLWFYVLYGSADAIPFSVFMNSLVFIGLMEVVALVGYGANIIKYRVPRKRPTQYSVQRTAGYAPPKKHDSGE